MLSIVHRFESLRHTRGATLKYGPMWPERFASIHHARDHARRILDAHADDVPTAIGVLENSALYSLFCSRGSEVVEWWEHIFRRW